MSGEIILAIITSSVGLMAIGASIQWLFTMKKPKRELKPIYIPPVIIKRTVETKYGRDLLDLAEKIYLSEDYWRSKTHPQSRAKLSVQKAHDLLSEVELFCHEIDKDRNKISTEELKKMFSNKQSGG